MIKTAELMSRTRERVSTLALLYWIFTPKRFGYKGLWNESAAKSGFPNSDLPLNPDPLSLPLLNLAYLHTFAPPTIRNWPSFLTSKLLKHMSNAALGFDLLTVSPLKGSSPSRRVSMCQNQDKSLLEESCTRYNMLRSLLTWLSSVWWDRDTDSQDWLLDETDATDEIFKKCRVIHTTYVMQHLHRRKYAVSVHL